MLAGLIADKMALHKGDPDRPGRSMRPSFASAETAKDLGYIHGILSADAAQHCRLGPGALAGLRLVRTREPELLFGCESLEEEVETLCAALRATRSDKGEELLSWMRPIDVEQVLYAPPMPPPTLEYWATSGPSLNVARAWCESSKE